MLTNVRVRAGVHNFSYCTLWAAGSLLEKLPNRHQDLIMAHRTTLKKKHKAFKSKHATKGQIKALNKGRVEKTGSGPKKHVLSKVERKNLADQIKDHKRKELESKLKIFGGKNGTPRNVCVIPLTPDVNSVEVVDKFQAALDGEIDSTVPGVMFVPRFKQNLRFFIPEYRNLYDLLDSARAADFVLFALSATTENTDYGEQIIRCISAQGCTTGVGTIWNLDGVEGSKKQAAVRECLTSWFSHFFVDSKLTSIDNTSELVTCASNICQKTPNGIQWRDERPYVVAEKMEIQPEGIVFQGIVRGQVLSSNQLVHLAGVGDLQITRIVEVPKHDTIEDNKVWEATNPESLDQLGDAVEFNEPEEEETHGVRIDGHQYISENIEDQEEHVETIKKVPKGMSQYQANWLLEDEDYGLSEESLDEDDMISDVEGELLEDETQEAGSDDDMEVEEEARQLKEYRDAKEDLDFPDEIELDPGASAKNRLAKYRGVRDLRTCEWDPYEADPRAPAEFGRLCRPGDLIATKNRLHKEAVEGARPGTRVQVYLPVSDEMRAHESTLADLAAKISKGVVSALYGLMKFEHQLSLVNMSIAPDSEWEKPLKSKDAIVVQYGPRRLTINPLYSSPGNQAENDVYKLYRYLHPGRRATASVIAPTMLGFTPVVYFTEGPQPQLIGTGNIMDSNPKRIIVKTAILTGHPFKIHKKLVTIRYMFFNSDDVNWFKHVPLFTKWGCSGFIKESLGTHGYFKATFDKKLNAQDTIAMALYKREWPKIATPALY